MFTLQLCAQIIIWTKPSEGYLADKWNILEQALSESNIIHIPSVTLQLGQQQTPQICFVLYHQPHLFFYLPTQHSPSFNEYFLWTY